MSRDRRPPVVTALLVAALSVVSVPLLAQWHGYPTPNLPRTPDGKVNLSAPVPRAPDGKPDLSGIWLASRARFNLAQSLKPGEVIPFTAEGRALYDERKANNAKDDPGARCLPTGVPVRATLATPFKLLQMPGVTAVLYESRTTFRQIMTDGRPLPKEIDWPTWAGFSVGHWQGDMFVAESAGFNGLAWLDQVGTPASSALRITEKFHRRDFGHMDLEQIIEDSKMYTRPWSIFAELVLQADTELLEFVCEENEKDSARMVGK